MKQPIQKIRNMLHFRKPIANSTVIIVKAPTSPSVSASASISTSTAESPPQVILSDVETDLNMHSPNLLYDNPHSDGADGVARRDEPIITSMSPPTNGDSMLNSTSPTEWSSAIGHAMTGKSGRVIHNLQEQITRLTRECNLHRTRAEEAQRMNEILKQQLQTVTDRLRNSEQSHEASLITIARKDRKIEDLKSETQSEKNRRLKAENDALETTQLAEQQREEHQRAFAEAQEVAQRSQCQYDALSQARLRDRNEFQSRFSMFRKDFDELIKREQERQNQLTRLDVIIEQKDREIRAARDRTERVTTLYEEYKTRSDDTLRQLVEKSRRNDRDVDAVLRDAREATDKMKWVVNVKQNVKGAR
ncbi:mother-specific HO expression [Microsporum audouinii]